MTKSASSQAYLERQRAFWDVDEATSRLGRVDTISRSSDEYENRADRDFSTLLAGLEARIDPDATVLEIGCGVGRLLSRLLAGASPKLAIGVDISPGMIAHARNALGFREELLLSVNSGEDLSMVPSDSVDLAFCNDVFIHIHNIDVVRRYLAEVRRVLKKSGAFRFNVRRMRLAKMFANSPGGLIAKMAYVSGVRSPLTRSENARPGFDGLQYRERDVVRLVANAGMKIILLRAEDGEADDHGRIWCTCQRA